MSTLFAWIRSPLVLIVLFAVTVRLPLLNGSFWLDEAAQALESQRSFSQQLQIVDDFQPPLLHYIVHFSMYLGTGEWWLRTMGALIPGIITIFYTYKIGALLWDKRTGSIAAILLSTSSFHIFYSQELRQYSLPAAFTAFGWFMLLKTWKTKQAPTTKELLLFMLCSSLGLYSSYLFPFVVISQVIFIGIFLKKQLNKWLLALFSSVVAFLPILPLFIHQLSAGSSLRVALPGWEEVVSFSQVKVLPLVLAKFIFGVSNVEISLTFVATSILLSVCLLFMYRQLKSKLFSQQMLAILIWLVVPILAAFLISYFVPVLQPKRVLYCLPAFYLLLAGATSQFKKLSFIQPANLFLSILLLINLTGIYHYWTDSNLQRENWRDLIQEIETKYPSQSATLFAFPEPFAPWVWYADPHFPAFTSGVILTDTKPNLKENLKKINEFNHVMVFEYLTDLTDPNDRLKKSLESFGYVEQGYFIYPNIGHVWIYSKPAAVISYTYERDFRLSDQESNIF